MHTCTAGLPPVQLNRKAALAFLLTAVALMVISPSANASSLPSVSAGGYFTCAADTNQKVACWGRNDRTQTAPPSTAFSSVTLGYAHACGLNSAGVASCWGDNTAGRTTPPASTNYVELAAGSTNTCGVGDDGTLSCFGDNTVKQSSPPAGQFEHVSAGFDNACAIAADRTLSCWRRQRSEPELTTGRRVHSLVARRWRWVRRPIDWVNRLLGNRFVDNLFGCAKGKVQPTRCW